MAKHTRKIGGSANAAALALGTLVLGAGLLLAPASNAEELVQVALLDLDQLEAMSDSELGEARGTGGEAPEVNASVSDQVAVILWDETKRQGTTNTGGNINVTVTVVEN